MRAEITEAVWLDEHQQFSLAELAELSGLSQTELRQLIDCEALPSAGVVMAGTRFGADCLILARTACRLRDDFDLDTSGLALALRLLDRIHGLEAQLRALHAQFPRHHK